MHGFRLALFLAAGQCFAQSPCQVRPGNHTVIVLLQNQPNAFEPACQPARLRVNDRSPVTLRVTGVSPVEICVVNSKAPAVTTVVNPVESIITTVTALKSFDFEAASKQLYDARVTGLRSLYLTPPANPDQQALNLFRQLAGRLYDTAKPVFDKQAHWQMLYQSDIDAMMTYLAADYRGANYTRFHPETDPLLESVRGHAALPSFSITSTNLNSPPSEIDYAALQALIDQMKSLQARLILSCTTAIAGVCDAATLQSTAELLDQANSVLSVAQDNLKTLQTSQATVATNYANLHKISVDFTNRLTAHLLSVNNGVLVQEIVLGPDYGATDTGSLSCSLDATPSQPTTDTINYSVLFQNVPALSVSAGLLTTFLEKREIGTITQLNSDGTYGTLFGITDSARASVFPMAFLNCRLQPPILKTWWGQPENELAITNSVSAGIGINSNTGTNQPEFFVGDALGFSRIYIHFGAHFGRTESLGGGYHLNTLVPTGFTGTPPIDWSYHISFSIGLSVRIAPF